MNLNVSGHHLEVTPAIRSYVRAKLERVTRHFDHVIDAHVILTVNKVRQKAEVTLHVRGKDLHCESEEEYHRDAGERVHERIGGHSCPGSQERRGTQHDQRRRVESSACAGEDDQSDRCCGGPESPVNARHGIEHYPGADR